jgi:hypothetical protein
MSKLGFLEQFISYKMLPVNGTTNFVSNGYGMTFSGYWSWGCQDEIYPFSCSKSAINYDKINNSLMLNSNPSYTVSLVNAGTSIEHIYPSIDENSAWVSIWNNSTGFRLVNTAESDFVWGSYCFNDYRCVPNINTSEKIWNNGVIGLDGSFWWNTSISADVYNSITKNFESTNIYSVYGVNKDGVVIAWQKGDTLACWVRGANNTSYVYRGKLLNYTYFNKTPDLKGNADNMYVQQPVPNIKYSRSIEYAYYKIHTENGKCELDLDDYTYIVSVSNNYYLFFDGITSKVAPIDNIYTGL